jgi:hypothetical protein
MEPAYAVEQEAREARRSGRTLGKHPLGTDMVAESSADGAKRAKMEADPLMSGLGIGKGPVIDVTGLGLPLHTVIELVISNLEVVSAEILERAFKVSYPQERTLISECKNSACGRYSGCAAAVSGTSRLGSSSLWR